MTQLPLEDLRPTLTADDDAVGFDRPWNPGHSVVLAFFFGVLVGGVLAALNYRRLGWGHRVRPVLAMVIAIAVVQLTTTIWVMLSQDWQVEEDVQFWSRLIHRVVAISVTGAIAWHQKRRYRLAVATGQEMGKLLKPALLAILVLWGGTVLLVIGIGLAFGPPSL